jgi:outer membrane protein assembly factor BamB
LRFASGTPLALAGAYSPWNYCQLDTADIDVGGSSPLVLPDLDPALTSTPHLLAFGSKQGSVYLLDRDTLTASDRRPACGADSSADRSLLAPNPQPQFGARGPLSVFGPYSELVGNTDHAKMRSTPAYFRDGAGTSFLFVSGSTKATVDATSDVPPSLARLRVVTQPGAPAYLALDAVDGELAFKNPGAPVVTSNGAKDAIVWVLDPNGLRTDSLLGCDAPTPILYAMDATTMRLLWRSGPGELHVGGKYSSVVVAHGVVFAGTDRVQAFGVRN